MPISGVVQFAISWKLISSPSNGNNMRYGRWNGTNGGYVEESRDADTKPKGIKDVHDTSRLPRTFYAMRFVRQKDELDTDRTNTETDQIDSSIKHTDIGRITTDIKDGVIGDSILSAVTETPSVEQLHGIEVKTQKSQLDGLQENMSRGDIKKVVTDDLPKQRPWSFFNVRQDKLNLSRHSLIQLKSLVLSRRENQSAVSIIHESADFSKLPKEFVFQDNTVDMTMPSHSCLIHINGVLVARGTASDKKMAKQAAAESALDLLQKTQPTIFIAANPGDLESAISRDEISRCKKNHDEIADTNIGNQLLRKMGWTGQGGLGKLGTGIATPLDVKESCYRAGLGVDVKDSNFISFGDAHDVIRNYAASKSLEELTFSPELTNPERAIIHRLSKRYELKSRSYNQGDVRYLVVSRKLSAIEIVRQLKLSGGVKGNVQLIAPCGEMHSPSTSSNILKRPLQ